MMDTELNKTARDLLKMTENFYMKEIDTESREMVLHAIRTAFLSGKDAGLNTAYEDDSSQKPLVHQGNILGN